MASLDVLTNWPHQFVEPPGVTVAGPATVAPSPWAKAAMSATSSHPSPLRSAATSWLSPARRRAFTLTRVSGCGASTPGVHDSPERKKFRLTKEKSPLPTTPSALKFDTASSAFPAPRLAMKMPKSRTSITSSSLESPCFMAKVAEYLRLAIVGATASVTECTGSFAVMHA